MTDLIAEARALIALLRSDPWLATPEEVADTIAALLGHIEGLEQDRHTLALALCGGEDYPGYLAAMPAAEIVKCHDEYHRMLDSTEAEKDRRIAELEAALSRINTLAGRVAHDLVGRVEGGKFAAVMQCAEVARVALAAGKDAQ